MNMADLTKSFFGVVFKCGSLVINKVTDNHARPKMLTKTTGKEGRKRKEEGILYYLF